MKKKSVMSILAALAVCATLQAKADEIAGNTPLTFYGVEMKREDQITLKEFKNYARSHGQANFVISKSPFVDYEGTGDVILATYETEQATAQKIADEIPGKGKLLVIHVSPAAMSTKRAVGVYNFPIMLTNDSVMGDVWVQAGNNPAQRIEKNVVLGSTKPNIANLFKFVGFSDKEGQIAYCLDQCTRYDLVSGNRTPLEASKSEDAAGIRRSIDNLLTKQDADSCKSNMASDQILNADKDGYYRGVCPAKGNQILQVQLKKDSGRWKVINSAWQQPMPAPR